jgi:hypothetical protein
LLSSVCTAGTHPVADKHYNFGAQSLSNIVYSAASMGLPPDYDVLHAVGRAVAWQAADFKPQGLANILWALGKLGVKLTHEVRAMVDALAREMAAQLTHARHKGARGCVAGGYGGGLARRGADGRESSRENLYPLPGKVAAGPGLPCLRST